MEQQTIGKMTLGARMRAAAIADEQDPLTAARKKAVKLGGEALVKFKAVEDFLEQVKAGIEAAVSNGEKPRPFRLDYSLASSLGLTYLEVKNPNVSPTNLHRPLVDEFSVWAASEEIKWKWQYGHDGVGMDSWFELVILPPA